MESVERLRSGLDRLFNKTVYGLIGALIVFYAAKTLLATSMFDGMTVLLIAAVIAALFFFKPGLAVFVYALAVFVSLGHINALAVTAIAVLILFFCGFSRLQAFCILILPLCFLPGNIFSGWQFCLLLLGLCLLSRFASLSACVLYGIYYSLLCLTTGSSGFGSVFPPLALEKATYVSFDAYTKGLNFEPMLNALISGDITVLIIAVAIYGVLAAVLMYLFGKLRIGIKKMAFDVADFLVFIIAGAALAGALYGTAKVFSLEYALPVGALALQTVVAYLISRPFASDTVVHKLSVSKAEIGGGGSVANPEITFDKWDSIAGYEETKKEIQSIIRPYTDKREYDRLVKAGMTPVKGLLLFGPPGTGKTTIARIIANETKMKLIVVNASSFLNMYVGESEKNLVDVFKKARAKAPCIICFDEIESFLMDRSKATRSYETSIVSTFLTQMDGYADLKDVLVIATTNNPTMIDPAALRPGRFDKLIYVGVPDEAARAVMFEKYLNGKAGRVDYKKLAENSERFTGADIKALCETAFRENDFKPLTEEQLMMRLSITRPSYTLEMQKMYELWGKKYNRSTGAQEDNQNKTAKRLCWDDIKGMDSVKAILREKIELPIQNAEKYKEYGITAPKGILLFGPPGCGKTFFAKVASDESNAAFYVINGPELLGGRVGESEENLRKVFMDARETKPSILFFDEIDAIAESRAMNAGSVRIINQLLTEMDGMETLSGVTVIAATNRPETLDPALLRAGRFDTKIYIPMPDQDSIRQMVLGYLGDMPCDTDVDAITEALAGYTCADVAAIINKAKALYVNRSIAGKDEPLHTSDIMDIISRVKPSVSPEEAAAYEAQRSLESWT